MSQASVSCQQCGKVYRWRPELAGKRAKCGCGAKVEFPAVDPSAAAPDPVVELAPKRPVPQNEAKRPSPPPRRASTASPSAPAAPDAPSDTRKKSKLRLIALGVGGITLVLLLLSLIVGGGGGWKGMPDSAGKQSKTVAGVDFYSFDGDTDLNVVSIEHEPRVAIGDGNYIEGKGSFATFTVRARDHWIFLWHNTHEKEGVQGVKSYVSGQYKDPRTGFPNDLARFWPPESSAAYGGTPWDQHLRNGFEFSHSFGATKTGRVYLATVRHPIDEATRERARKFIDDAINRPRAIHHAQAIATLMRACRDMNDPKWQQWLRDITSKSAEELVAQAQPVDDKIIKPALLAAAARARSEAAVTLALATKFKDASPLVSSIANPVEFAVTRAIFFDAVSDFKDDKNLIAGMRAYAGTQSNKALAEPIKSVISTLDRGSAFDRLFASDPIASEEVADFDRHARVATEQFILGTPDPAKGRLKAMQAAELIIAQPIDSPRLPYLLDIVFHYDPKAFITCMVNCMEKAQHPWPQWMQKNLGRVAHLITGRGGGIGGAPDEPNIEHGRQYADRFIAIAKTLPAEKEIEHDDLRRIAEVYAKRTVD